MITYISFRELIIILCILNIIRKLVRHHACDTCGPINLSKKRIKIRKYAERIFFVVYTYNTTFYTYKLATTIS